MGREATRAALVVALSLPACGNGEHSDASGASGTGSGGGHAGAAVQPAAGATSRSECPVDGDGKTTLVFVNGCSRPLSYRGSDIDGGTLAPGAHACVDIGSDTEALSSKRYWGFVGDDPGAERHSLAEFTFNTDFNDFDWYNISHVDASNLPMEVSAVEMPNCRTLSCPNSLLADCPEVGKVEDSSGKVISCYSPMRDDKNSPIAQYFEKSCKDAYSWSGDDQDSVVACAGEDYDVVFCP